MTEQHFKAAVTPELPPEAQHLVDIYNNTYGSSGPGCNPAGLANVLDRLANDALRRTATLGAGFTIESLQAFAAQLRGEQ